MIKGFLSPHLASAGIFNLLHQAVRQLRSAFPYLSAQRKAEGLAHTLN